MAVPASASIAATTTQQRRSSRARRVETSVRMFIGPFTELTLDGYLPGNSWACPSKAEPPGGERGGHGPFEMTYLRV
jgi:hypothetical protein